jgi:hypothetical protein
VYWTPRVEITDRGLLEIGDGVVFGHRAKFFGHLIAPGRGGLLLFVKRGRVGAGAFVGAYAVLGPGADVPAGALLEVGQHVNARDRWVPAERGDAPASADARSEARAPSGGTRREGRRAAVKSAGLAESPLGAAESGPGAAESGLGAAESGPGAAESGRGAVESPHFAVESGHAAVESPPGVVEAARPRADGAAPPRGRPPA